MGAGESGALAARSVAELVSAMQSGGRIKFLFFWSHESPSGVVDQHCLSQWYPSPFHDESGRAFASAEHYMMWHKAALFGDTTRAEKILSARTPGEAKALGRHVSNFSETAWTERRWDIVVSGSVLKFRSHPKLETYLAGTRNRVLVEASPLDRLWGNGLEAASESAQRPDRWPGSNLLGFALMEARTQLAQAKDGQAMPSLSMGMRRQADT